jgi:hypothetical protein
MISKGAKMHKKIRFQTSFKLTVVAAIVVTIFGWFAFTPTMAESGVTKLSDIQVLGEMLAVLKSALTITGRSTLLMAIRTR